MGVIEGYQVPDVCVLFDEREFPTPKKIPAASTRFCLFTCPHVAIMALEPLGRSGEAVSASLISATTSSVRWSGTDLCARRLLELRKIMQHSRCFRPSSRNGNAKHSRADQVLIRMCDARRVLGLMRAASSVTRSPRAESICKCAELGHPSRDLAAPVVTDSRCDVPRVGSPSVPGRSVRAGVRTRWPISRSNGCG